MHKEYYTCKNDEYEDVRGKTIFIIGASKKEENKKIVGLLAEIEDDIGLTIVEEKDYENYLLCIVCTEKLKNIKNHPTYNMIINAIRNNQILDFNKIIEFLNQVSVTYGNSPTKEFCAFNQ